MPASAGANARFTIMMSRFWNAAMATTSAVVSVVAFDSGEWDLEVSGADVGRLDLTSPILGARFPDGRATRVHRPAIAQR